jgi:hypothetical protein
MKINSITISAGATLSLKNGAVSWLNIDKGYINGALELDLNFSLSTGDFIYASDTIEIVNGSSLTINLLDLSEATGNKITIISALNSLTYTDGYFWGYDESVYDIYKEGNSIIAELIGTPPEPPTPPVPPAPPTPALSLKNNFIANTLTLGANNVISDMLYERMNSDNEKGAWLGFYGNSQDFGDFSASGGGAVAGVDFYHANTSIIGAYVRYGANSSKQDSDKATMSDIELGLYGKTEIANQFNLKGNISGGLQTYSVTTNEDYDFNTKSLRGGAEVEYITPVGNINLKPFIGLRGGLSSNDKIKEIKADTFTRVETIAGIGIDGKLGEVQNISYYGKLYGKYVAAGANPKYKISDNEVEGTTEPEIQGALTLGAELTISPPISLFINGGINFGSDLFGFGGGAGVNYRF